MTSSDTNIGNLIVNKLTRQQWITLSALGKIHEDEIYDIIDNDDYFYQKTETSSMQQLSGEFARYTVINRLTQAEYDELSVDGKIDDKQIYCITDADEEELSNILSDYYTKSATSQYVQQEVQKIDVTSQLTSCVKLSDDYTTSAQVSAIVDIVNTTTRIDIIQEELIMTDIDTRDDGSFDPYYPMVKVSDNMWKSTVYTDWNNMVTIQSADVTEIVEGLAWMQMTLENGQYHIESMYCDTDETYPFYEKYIPENELSTYTNIDQQIDSWLYLRYIPYQEITVTKNQVQKLTEYKEVPISGLYEDETEFHGIILMK